MHASDQHLKCVCVCVTYCCYICYINRGKDIESHDMLRQGFTHAILMTFNSKEDFTAFMSHPNHVEFSAIFSAAIDKIVVLDFPAVLVKPQPAAA